jgi:hypothetical protein
VVAEEEATMKEPFGESAEIPGSHIHAIARLAGELHVPLKEVADVYQSELNRINASARLHHFVTALAASHARGILLRSKRHLAT